MDENKRVIEVGGVKMEIDLRYAKTIDTYRVGDNVKLLKKNYGDSFTSYPGVIIGFDAFALRPTIVIAYVKLDYTEAGVQFEFLNADTKEVEICPMNGPEHVIDKQRAVDMLDKGIAIKERELEDLKAKKNYFLKYFNQYFVEPVETQSK